MKVNTVLQDFEKALVEINRTEANKIFNDAVNIYMSDNMNTIEKKVQTFIDEIIMVVMGNIGSKWEEGAISLSQVYMSSKICEQMLDEILTKNVNFIKTSPKIAITTLEDHHLLGKRIVKSVIQTGGYSLIDLGHGVTISEVVEMVNKEEIEILLVSTLMFPSALKVKALREKLYESGKEVKILVGGAPYLFDSELWKRVGADAMGKSALDSLRILEKWVKEC